MNWIAVVLTFVVGAVALCMSIALGTGIDLFIKWAVSKNWEAWQITITIMTPGIMVWAIVNGLTKKEKP